MFAAAYVPFLAGFAAIWTAVGLLAFAAGFVLAAEFEFAFELLTAVFVFAAAVLHFIDDHRTLLPGLLRHLNPGGCLAAHMPDWRDALWYQLMLDTLNDAGPCGRPIGTAQLRQRMAARPLLPLEDYYRLLAPLTQSLDIWETEQLQVVALAVSGSATSNRLISAHTGERCAALTQSCGMPARSAAWTTSGSAGSRNTCRWAAYRSFSSVTDAAANTRDSFLMPCTTRRPLLSIPFDASESVCYGAKR